MKVVALLAVGLLGLVACQQGVDTDLTEEQLLNVELASAENVAVYGSPPMIPADHPIVMNEDYSGFENGGNGCLECHNSEDEDVPQTLHPDRHNCVQCHIEVTDETATADDFKVENDFEKYVPVPN